MEFTNPQNFTLILAMLGAGILAGYMGGLLGIGGGIVLVPTLVTILPHFGTEESIVMQCSVATCLALIIPLGFMAARKQYQMGKLDLKLFWSWVPPVVAGIIAGSFLINYFSSKSLKILFTFFLLFVTIYSIFRKHEEKAQRGAPHGFSKNIVGFLIGGISVMLGIGGGVLTTPYCKITGYPIKKSIAFSSATVFLIGLGGTIGAIYNGWGVPGRAPHSLGFVNIPGFLVITPVVMLFSPLGTRTTNALTEQNIKWIYALFLSLLTIYMFFKTFN